MGSSEGPSLSGSKTWALVGHSCSGKALLIHFGLLDDIFGDLGRSFTAIPTGRAVGPLWARAQSRGQVIAQLTSLYIPDRDRHCEPAPGPRADPGIQADHFREGQPRKSTHSQEGKAGGHSGEQGWCWMYPGGMARGSDAQVLE